MTDRALKDADHRSLREQGEWHLRRARHRLVSDPPEEAQLALDLLEEWYRRWVPDQPPDKATTIMWRSHFEDRMMEAALRAGQLDRASELAKSVLLLEQELTARWPDHVPDSAIHSAWITLGHVALRFGEIEESERDLLAAARVPGRDPVLISYGPDLELAQGLLERGSSEVVIEYLNSWRTRWKVGRELIDWWVAQIAAGKAARVDKWKYLKTRRFRDIMPGLRSLPRRR